MRNVRCGVCISYLDDGKCKIKKVKVAAGKKRTCDFYVFDKTKVVEKKILPSKRTLPSVLAKAQRSLMRKEAKLKAMKESHIKKHTDKHPLTGNLDIFKTTASEEK